MSDKRSAGMNRSGEQPAPWRREGRRDNDPRPGDRPEPTPEEAVRIARKRVAAPAMLLFISWALVSVVALLILAYGLLYATGVFVADPNTKWVLDDGSGSFFLKLSAGMIPFCVFGIVSAVRLFSLRGYWMGVTSCWLLVPLGMVCGGVMIAFPMTVLVLLTKKSVKRGFQLVATKPNRSEENK